jgi:hypothetical protein
MDIDTFTCMEAAGLITDAQRAQLSKIATRLPQNNKDLLQVIAAASVARIEGEQFFGSPIGSESITSSAFNDVKALTVPEGATRAIVSVHENNIIFRMDGQDPTDTAGHIGSTGSNFSVGSLLDFRFVSGVAGNAIIFVSYF